MIFSPLRYDLSYASHQQSPSKPPPPPTQKSRWSTFLDFHKSLRQNQLIVSLGKIVFYGWTSKSFSLTSVSFPSWGNYLIWKKSEVAKIRIYYNRRKTIWNQKWHTDGLLRQHGLYWLQWWRPFSIGINHVCVFTATWYQTLFPSLIWLCLHSDWFLWKRGFTFFLPIRRDQRICTNLVLF